MSSHFFLMFEGGSVALDDYLSVESLCVIVRLSWLMIILALIVPQRSCACGCNHVDSCSGLTNIFINSLRKALSLFSAEEKHTRKSLPAQPSDQRACLPPPPLPPPPPMFDVSSRLSCLFLHCHRRLSPWGRSPLTDGT